MTDPIGDMLNRLQTAQTAKKETAEIPFSRQGYAIAKILAREGFVKQAEFKGKRKKRIIEVQLLYDDEDKIPRIAGVRRVSKPGQRTYAAAAQMRRVKNGRGIAIISTSKGLLCDREARKENVGGEVLCEIWG